MHVYKAPQKLLLAFLFGCLVTQSLAGYSRCFAPETVDYSLRQQYCDQPIFANFVQKTEENQLVDNICVTYFPLPDDPTTFTLYQSRVFCDGSSDIQTFIGTEIGKGQAIVANPFETLHDYVIGYAGCDTYILYRCVEYGGDGRRTIVAGFSPKCQPIGLSCLRKVEEVLSSRGLPDNDYYVLPMKLPNRCITQQLCIAPPNPFYNKLSSVALY